MTDNLHLLINALFKSQVRTTFSHCDHREGDKLLVEWIVDHNPNITAEKARLITSMYRDSWGISPEGHSETNAFFPLVHFVKDKAVFNEGRVKVKLEELLRWRQMANCIGEDLMMASWLAYHFRWTDEDDSAPIKCGVLAQDLLGNEELKPFVTTTSDENGSEFYGVNYGGLGVAIAVGGVKELYTLVKSLQNRIEELESVVSTLKNSDTL